MLTEIEKYHITNKQTTNTYLILIILGMLLGLIKDAEYNYYFFTIPASIVIVTCIIFLFLPYPTKQKSNSKIALYFILLLNLFYYQLLFRYDSALLLLIPMTISIGIYFDYSSNNKSIISIMTLILILLLTYYSSNLQIVHIPVSNKYQFATDFANYVVLIIWTLFSLYISYKRSKHLIIYDSSVRKVIENASNHLTSKEELTELHYLIDNDYTIFYMKFKQLYPSFIHKLEIMAPNLVVEEVKVIILSFLGYSTKQLSELTNCSTSSIEAKKHRIRKKLNVPVELTLPDFLKRI